jgi:SWI/SNF-related matrix-associated actin-dependent regulator of chromatin subfamily A member 5
VEKYSKVFFEKMETLADFEKIKKNLEKAEKTLSFKSKAPELIKNKVILYENPIDEMMIYATQKSKYFSKESDIILLCLTNIHGYGNWREIKKAIRRDPRCRFDHLFISRNESEIARRVDILVKALEKEDLLNKKKLELQE